MNEKKNMEKFGTQGLWRGIVNGTKQVINVVGTYGNIPSPIVRIERGIDVGKAFAIEWETGKVIKEINLI